ncbi:MAG: DsrE family protein [Thermomicrobiales bacterium]|nr:DsrE family protein [Thermomicrobiales bacterium]
MDHALSLTRRAAAGAVAAAVAGLAAGQPLAAAQETPAAGAPADFRVVLHVADADRWVYTLSNLENLTSEWPDARIRVVVDGSGVYPLQGRNDLTERLAAAQDKGVKLYVCPNALREHKIDPISLAVDANTSLGGVVALVQAQREGYGYVKP